jgi:hypothetical protein
MMTRVIKARQRKILVGRKITCNRCAHKTVKGTARVMRKVLFFFCPKCWADRHACELQMNRATELPAESAA